MMWPRSPETRRLVAVLTSTAALGTVAWHVALEPRVARVSEKRQTLSALEARIAADRRAANRAATLERALRARARRRARDRTRQDSPATITAWLKAIGDLAQEGGLEVRGFKPTSSTKETGRGSWHATFDLEGTYQPLRTFIEGLERDDATDVTELTLSVAARVDGRTRLRASCVIARVGSPGRGAS